jgi:hypothetical protein
MLRAFEKSAEENIWTVEKLNGRRYCITKVIIICIQIKEDEMGMTRSTHWDRTNACRDSVRKREGIDH